MNTAPIIEKIYYFYNATLERSLKKFGCHQEKRWLRTKKADRLILIRLDHAGKKLQ
jgi:hypothetical protein